MLLLVIVSCKGSGPTELIYDDSEDLDIEILTPNPDLLDYASDFDSTGTINQIPAHSNVISVNGIKTTTNSGIGIEHYYASAMFFDKSKPVKLPNNRLIGYVLQTFGMVSFDNSEARKAVKRIRYLYNGVERDTLLGSFYELRKGRGPMHQRGFPYNSFVEFKMTLNSGQNINFNIPTPEEITGQVKLRGNRKDKNIQLAVEWNGLGNGKIDIIVAGSVMGNNIEPFFKVKVDDNGSFVLREELLRNIPFDHFRVLVVSLERTKELYYSGPYLNDNYIAGKSIHNIKFNVP